MAFPWTLRTPGGKQRDARFSDRARFVLPSAQLRIFISSLPSILTTSSAPASKQESRPPPLSTRRTHAFADTFPADITSRQRRRHGIRRADLFWHSPRAFCRRPFCSLSPINRAAEISAADIIPTIIARDDRWRGSYRARRND